MRIIHLRQACSIYEHEYYKKSAEWPSPLLVNRNVNRTSIDTLSRRLCSNIGENRSLNYTDADACLVFNEREILLNNITTVLNAKIYADKCNKKLTYMNKNPDGVHCFRIEKHTKKSALEAARNKPEKPLRREAVRKPQKETTKEFKFKSTTDDHDISIKVKRISAQLEKGKNVIVLFNIARKDSKDFRISASQFSKKLSEALKPVGQVRQELSSDRIYKFSVQPRENIAT